MRRSEIVWRACGRELRVGERAVVMGILNVTPDSFSDGGRHADLGAAVAHAEEMVAAGADVIDVGGESTRPGARPVGEAEEIARVVPVIEALRGRVGGALLSVDSCKPGVVRAALEEGAEVVNDVRGFRDRGMIDVVAGSGCGLVVMHMQGEPRTMQLAPRYDDVVGEVRAFFRARLEDLRGAGVEGERCVLDPGIGFGKGLEHNLELLRRLEELEEGGRPVLVGASRKSFLGALGGEKAPGERRWETVAVTAFARERGAAGVRVHDVRENVQALRMVEAVIGAGDQRWSRA